MIWPHKTSEDLATAGYKCRGSVRCSHCDAIVDIYQIPGRMPVFLNTWDHYPHLILLHNEQPPTPPVDGKSAAAGRNE